MPVRSKSWALWCWGGLFLLAFCWLGAFAMSSASLLEGLENRLPATTRLSIQYGPVVFPLFGVVAAVSLVLIDRFCRTTWAQLLVISGFALVLICSFRTVLMPCVIMGSTG